MSDYALVPVEYPPDFENGSLIPVEYNPFSADGVTQLAQAQQAQTQAQPTEPTPQGQPQQPATDANQPVLDAPATGSGGDAGNTPNNPPSDQGRPPEPDPFGGFANPTPTESLVNQAKMYDQRRIIRADRSEENGFEFGERDGPYEL